MSISTVSEYTVTIKVLELQTDATLETSTDTTVTITSHGLETGDFFVNLTERALTLLQGERGSRKITKVDDHTFTIYPAISGQTAGNEAYLYKFVDRTSKLVDGSLQIKLRAGGHSEASFVLNSQYEIQD
jgi:hypothetical protein